MTALIELDCLYLVMGTIDPLGYTGVRGINSKAVT